MRHMIARRWLAAVVAGALITCLAPSAQAIEVAGELFVDLNAATFKTGDPIWTNAGTYTDFLPFGTPTAGVTTDAQGNKTPAIFFDGASAFYGEDVAPEGLTGPDPSTTIEVWAINDAIADEETLVSWGKRGGPDGTNMAFNYGRNGLFGAVGHWGSPDLGWKDAGGAPEAKQWHHLVYTYDETTTRVYADGVLWNQEDVLLNTHMDPAIAIASQWEADGTTLTGALKGTLAIGRVRIHDGALSDAQILSNYNAEKAAFFNPAPPEPPKPQPVPANPVHRYSFNNPASNNATGATIVDSIGGQDGIVVGEGSSFTGTQVKLNGGDMTIAAYVDLPNGLISKLTDATMEGWMTLDGVQSWQRVFDFGSNERGELTEPGPTGGTPGYDQWMLSASRGNDFGAQRYSLRNLDPEFGGAAEGIVGDEEQLVDTDAATQLGQEFHFAAIYDSDGSTDGGPVIRVYRNGAFVASRPVTIELGNLNDVNNWLGRSNWTYDLNTQGSYNEFRIYDYAFNASQVLGSYLNGPATINLGLVGDYNNNGSLDAGDLDLQAIEIAAGTNKPTFDLTGDGKVDLDDRLYWVENPTMKNSWLGDADLNGVFNSDDFVLAFQAGKYEVDGATATWEQGDWNGDLLFTSGDFVSAFASGGYEVGPRAAVAAVPEPAGVALLLMGALAVLGLRRRT